MLHDLCRDYLASDLKMEQRMTSILSALQQNESDCTSRVVGEGSWSRQPASGASSPVVQRDSWAFSQRRMQLPIDCYGDMNLLWTNQRTQSIVDCIATEMDAMDRTPFFSFETSMHRMEEAIRENKRLDTGEEDFSRKPSCPYAVPSSFIRVTNRL